MTFSPAIKRFRPAISMIMVQVFATVMLLLSKLCLDRGMNIFALMTYRHLVAAAFVAPFAYFFDRDGRKKLTFLAFLWMFICALLGITMGMGFYYYGLLYTSTTIAATFLNVVPVVTFVFAVILRMETAGLTTVAGRVKVAGTVMCVSGAMIVTLYKGSSVNLLPSLWHTHHGPSSTHLVKPNWVRGGLLLVMSSMSYSAWYIAQVKLFKVYPARYAATTLICLLASLQAVVLGFALQRDLTIWKLGLNLRLLTIVYSGIFSSAATFCLISWCVSKKGPIYATMFNPVLLVLVCISGSVLLGESLYIGSILGSALIVTGLYSYLWGKKKESAHKECVQVQESTILDPSESLHAKAVVPVSEIGINMHVEKPAADQQ